MNVWIKLPGNGRSWRKAEICAKHRPELAEFQNQQIQTGVKEELERQVRILVQDYGGAVAGGGRTD